MIAIEKLKKLKKGDKIKINGGEYLVENFDTNTFYDEKTGEKKGIKEIILSKSSQDSKKTVRQKYIIKYNEKNKEIGLYKLSQEKETSPRSFKFKSSKSLFSYKEKK